jgi:hypothetical protein
MTGRGELGDYGVKQRGSVPSPLRFVNDEERPDVSGLMVRASKALNSSLILRNKEDRLVHVPSNFFVADKTGIEQTILRCSAPDLINARKIGAGGRTQGGNGHGPHYQLIALGALGSDWISLPECVCMDGGAPGTPEPSTWVMMIMGFAGYRGSRKSAVEA